MNTVSQSSRQAIQVQGIVAGIDEVGRGCLAGAVVAAVVILDPCKTVQGLTDSKKLTKRRREQLVVEIKEKAMDWSVGRAEPSEIDALNILQASLLAMSRAFKALRMHVDFVKVDGKFYPPIDCPGIALVAGDLSEPAISAASIIAKVTRDAEMQLLDDLYPGYGFAQHKGYPTKNHLAGLQELGVCEVHRKTFKPVKKFLSS